MVSSWYLTFPNNRIHQRHPPRTRPDTLPPNLAAWYQQHLLSLPHIPLDQLVRGWFFNAPLCDIHRDNVRGYYSYIFAMEEYGCLSDAVQQQVDDVIDAIEQRIGHPFLPGMLLLLRMCCQMQARMTQQQHMCCVVDVDP